jgi:ubiquinone/menaquinone biosynthesis C-methylase UbiE
MSSTFDDQAATYDRWFATPLGRLVDEVEKQAIFSLAPEVQGRRILEIGCGTGNFSLTLAHKRARVVGFDCSDPMLARAQDKVSGQDLDLTWVRGLGSQLPFVDESFDGVMCILAMDFMPEREIALREMVRVLRFGGFLLVGMLNRFSLWTLERTIYSWFKPSLWRKVRFITHKELRRLLSGPLELTDIRTRQAVYFPPWASRLFLPRYPYIENLGDWLNLPTGTFLVAAATKSGTMATKQGGSEA